MRRPFQAAVVRALTLLALAQGAIGAAAIFARFALTAGGPLWTSALRVGIAALPVAAVAASRGVFVRPHAPTERRLLLGGVLLALHFGVWISSLRYASVAISTLLVCTTPVFTEAWAFARTRRARPLAIAGIAAAIAGVAVVATVPATATAANAPLGMALALAGALAFAGYLLVVRASDARYTTLRVIARTYPVAALLLALAAFALRDSFPPLAAHAAWGGILAMALFSQLFGHTAVNAAVRTLSPTIVGLTILLEPVIAAGAAAIVFGERLTAAAAAGALLILAGIGLALGAERPAGVE